MQIPPGPAALVNVGVYTLGPGVPLLIAAAQSSMRQALAKLNVASLPKDLPSHPSVYRPHPRVLKPLLLGAWLKGDLQAHPLQTQSPASHALSEAGTTRSGLEYLPLTSPAPMPGGLQRNIGTLPVPPSWHPCKGWQQSWGTGRGPAGTQLESTSYRGQEQCMCELRLPPCPVPHCAISPPLTGHQCKDRITKNFKAVKEPHSTSNAPLCT